MIGKFEYVQTSISPFCIYVDVAAEQKLAYFLDVNEATPSIDKVP